MLPHVMMSTPKTSVSGTAGTTRTLSVQQTLERLMLLSDQTLLPGVEQDFDTTYRLVTGHHSSRTSDRGLGALIYREADTTTGGSEE